MSFTLGHLWRLLTLLESQHCLNVCIQTGLRLLLNGTCHYWLDRGPYSGELIFAQGGRPKVTDPSDYGGGIVNPNVGKNPSLIYDMGRRDYIAYLCGMGYSETAISLLTGQTILCRNSTPSILDVNIPSITVPNLRGRPVTVLRALINVGSPNSEYQVFIDPPHGTTVEVKPRQLSFSTEYYFGGLTWTDGVHKARIPISVKAIFPLVSDY